jgi:hypothetical protein
MGEDEEGTLAALKAIRRELADPRIKEHRGRIVKLQATVCCLSSPALSMQCAARLTCSATWRSETPMCRQEGTDGQQPNPPLALPDKPSIAALPFQNMSGDSEQEYFADGMVEEIIPVATSRAR